MKNMVFQSLIIINQKKTKQDIAAEELGLLAIATSNWQLPAKDRTKKQEDKYKFILVSKTSKKKKRESMKK